LSIGDLILFQDVARNLILSVDGILLEDVLATDGINLQDSLFCVHLKHEYSASRDLNAFLAEYDMDIKKIEEESAKKFLKALQVRPIVKLYNNYNHNNVLTLLMF
jgi:hypothetical protein